MILRILCCALLALTLISCDQDDPMAEPALSLQTVPPGAQVWLDGDSTGQATPFVRQHFPPGSHEIQYRLPGYRRLTVRWHMVPGSTLSRVDTLRQL